jgi:hypothetical protein
MVKVLGKIIDLLRDEGIDIRTPYDLSNWFEDNTSHSEQFKTGRFDDLKEENEDFD